MRLLAQALPGRENAISIHAPREGCDRYDLATTACATQFQSTHPARGATAAGQSSRRYFFNFNPRTPRGVRRYAEGRRDRPARFQSTHPARGATVQMPRYTTSPVISIHAPREGCDSAFLRVYFLIHEFQSTHPARGATLEGGNRRRNILYFNPRTPRGVRHFARTPHARTGPISIHAPREGCDGDEGDFVENIKNFNPRTPRGVRLPPDIPAPCTDAISIHAPREGCDW